MAYKRFILRQGKGVRGDQLADEITAGSSANITVDEITVVPKENADSDLRINDIPDGIDDIIQSIIDSHIPNPLYTERDREVEQRRTVNDNVKALFQGLAEEEPSDAAYIAYGRSVAKINGENNATILGIDTRQKAVQYIAGTSEWQALPAAAKTWLALSKRAEMLMWQALINFIR